jgi:hypothetical protein
VDHQTSEPMSDGHPLGPNQVLVGHVACLGHGVERAERLDGVRAVTKYLLHVASSGRATLPGGDQAPTAWRYAVRSGMEMVSSVPGDVERTSNRPPDASTFARIDAIPI